MKGVKSVHEQYETRIRWDHGGKTQSLAEEWDVKNNTFMDFLLINDSYFHKDDDQENLQPSWANKTITYIKLCPDCTTEQ